MKDAKSRAAIEFLSNVLALTCLGIIVDYFAHTTWIFTVIGAVVGLAAAIVLNQIRKKKNREKEMEK